MLMIQYYLNTTNQPYGPPRPACTSLIENISRDTGRHSPNSVLAELRQGYTIEVPEGFYQAFDDGRDFAD